VPLAGSGTSPSAPAPVTPPQSRGRAAATAGPHTELVQRTKRSLDLRDLLRELCALGALGDRAVGAGTEKLRPGHGPTAGPHTEHQGHEAHNGAPRHRQVTSGEKCLTAGAAEGQQHLRAFNERASAQTFAIYFVSFVLLAVSETSPSAPTSTAQRDRREMRHRRSRRGRDLLRGPLCSWRSRGPRRRRRHPSSRRNAAVGPRETAVPRTEQQAH